MNTDEKGRIENEIIALLYEVYTSDAFRSLIELCQGEAMVLIYLNDEKKTVNPAQISKELDISRQRVTSILSALRKKEYISMEICETDRRRMNVKITQNGAEYISAKIKKGEKYFDILIEKMGIENIMNFVRQLNTAAKYLDGLSD
ncbi:MarR family transcriptional regulator [Ruminococcus sp. Marseille-P6503]|uniref:MarR family winged helix-turn-helix transcriptional regulator n=1 Tax=Ruminococcus sp. Marseille-P6503 TaxID=2364796 RepID=UPI000F536101|nr:MarR family transcriptional regulator [Ruminococcus sp. Marseille-P6503]